MPGAQGPKTVKGAQSDPNYVSRLLSRSECLPWTKIIVTPSHELVPYYPVYLCIDLDLGCSMSAVTFRTYLLYSNLILTCSDEKIISQLIVADPRISGSVM